MTLEYKVESVPEEHKALYQPAEDGNGFVLDVNGVVPADKFEAEKKAWKQKVAEFRNNNTELMKKASAGGPSEEEIAATVEERIASQYGEMRKENKKLKGENDVLKSHLDNLVLSDGVKGAAINHGVLETALEDVVTRARSFFDVKDGKAVPKNGQADKEGKPFTIDSWIPALAETAPHLFGKSTGSGSKSSARMGVAASGDKSPIDKIASGLAAGQAKTGPRLR